MRTVSAPNTDSASSLNPAGAEILQRARGAYLGLAIGDSLGATVEFLTPREIATQYKQHREIIGGGWLRLKPGAVTDDTEMSLALGNSILAAGEVDACAAAEAFSDWMRSKPVDIGATVRRGIVHYRNSGEPAIPENEHNAGNGAVMRCLPVALVTLGDGPEAVREAMRRQAHVTHNCPLADAGGNMFVQLLQSALMGADKIDLQAEMESLVAEHQAYAFKGRRQENPTGFIVDTLRAVFQALTDTNSFQSALIDVVNRGGDADTTGAILGMLAGALYGPEAIPRRWINRLDKQVREACEQQAETLIALAPVMRGLSA